MFDKKEYNKKYRKSHKSTNNKYSKDWYLNNKERSNNSSKLLYKKNKAYYLAYQKRKHMLLKQEVIAVYGGRCTCCSESILDFLEIDHINNDGNKHRKVVKGGMLYKWLKKSNWPENFQILCSNCNLSKRINKGICFHKLNSSVVQG